MHGRYILALAAALAGASGGIPTAIDGTTEAGLGMALRWTARASLVFFLLAFTASSVNRLWPGGLGKWLLRNRRELGLSFALLHFTHAGFIAARVIVHSDNFWGSRSVASLVPGTFAYLLLLAMTITSFARPRKWLGRARWNVLHKVGVYALWLIFTLAYAKGVSDEPAKAAGVAFLIAGLLLRGAARRARTSRSKDALLT
jgi:DMSO/TMAO reductase YedYZ heme-binding membrane subunit